MKSRNILKRNVLEKVTGGTRLALTGTASRKKDGFALAEGNNGRLVRIEVDCHTAPYIPAQTVNEHVTCPECGPNLGSLALVGRSPMRRGYCGSCDHFWEEPLIKPS